MNIPTRPVLALAAAGLALAALTACSPAAEPSSPNTQEQATTTNADAITVQDTWVKSAESGMTSTFGVLHNSSGEDINIVAVRTEASEVAELHETVEDDSGALVMRRIEGGFIVPAGGSFTLEPASNHLMLMDLAAPLTAGEEVAFTLEFADGSTLEFTAVVKDYAGANETYVGDDDMGDMDMGDE